MDALMVPRGWHRLWSAHRCGGARCRAAVVIADTDGESGEPRVGAMAQLFDVFNNVPDFRCCGRREGFHSSRSRR